MPVNLTSHIRPEAHGCSPFQIKRYVEKILDEFEVCEYNVNILITDDLEIRHLNKKYRNKDSATNVLSFPFSDGLDENLSFLPIKELGDIVISLETAKKEAIRYREHLSFRIYWLVTHGVLHLLDYDHERSDEEARKMLAKEQELLASFRID